VAPPGAPIIEYAGFWVPASPFNEKTPPLLEKAHPGLTGVFVIAKLPSELTMTVDPADGRVVVERVPVRVPIVNSKSVMFCATLVGFVSRLIRVRVKWLALKVKSASASMGRLLPEAVPVAVAT
jgi:hypothetical protein